MAVFRAVDHFGGCSWRRKLTAVLGVDLAAQMSESSVQAEQVSYALDLRHESTGANSLLAHGCPANGIVF